MQRHPELRGRAARGFFEVNMSNTPEGYQFLNLHFTKTQDMLDRGSVLKRKQNLIFWIG